MSTYRSFCYNPSPNGNISGTEQVGNIAAATGNVSIDPSKQWWNGPDEDLGYVVAYSDGTGTRSNGPKRILSTNYPCNLGFMRSSAKTDESFINLVKTISGSQSLASASAAKTWLTTNGYWTSYTTYVLDMVNNQASGAYSLRKLKGSYSGSAIRVRRSSDNTEQDIGFDGNGNLNQSALTSFVGAGNGFIVTWYDQSGNGVNFTWWQAVTQAKIVSSGVVETLNGKPCINTNGINVYYRPNHAVNGYTYVDYQTLFAIGKIETTGNNFIFSYEDIYEKVFINSSGNFDFQKHDAGTPYPGSPFLGGRGFTLSGPSTNPYMLYMSMRNLNLYASHNGNSESLLGAWGNGMRTTRLFFGNTYYQGKMSEIILWNSNESSSKSLVETNLNNYYSIY